MDSGTGITGVGSGYAALLAHAGGALYGMELGSVTLKRIGFFCFPIKHSTHTWGGLDLSTMDSGTGITGASGGSGYAAILAHAGGVLYGTELGSVT
jgi:hypothetical protein